MRKRARLNRTFIGDWRLVREMIVARSLLILCCAGACVCVSVNITEDSGDQPLNTTHQAADHLETVVIGDQDIEGSERVALPVAFSYSSTTQPRVFHGGGRTYTRTVVHHGSNDPSVYTLGPSRQRARSYQIPTAAYTLMPVLHHARPHPPSTTVEVEKQEMLKHEEEEQRPSSGEDVGDDHRESHENEDEEKEKRADSKEDVSSSHEQEYDEGDFWPEHYEESESRDVINKNETPRRQTVELQEELVGAEEQGQEQEEDLDSRKEKYTRLKHPTIRRPKKHQKVEDGLDKVLQSPVKFAYSGDSNPSASGQKEEHGGGEYEKGGGDEHHSEHHSSHGEKDDKGYDGHHEYEKEKKGHHDKEDHEKKYSDHEGKKAKHKDAAGHVEAHHHEKKGKKGTAYKEKGKHKKGHSTKGHHNIHKMDEYVKKHEFYDEHHEGGEHEKHGGYHEKHDQKHGGKHEKGRKHGGYHDDHHGKKGHYKKGKHDEEHKGHKKASGHKEHHGHKEKYGKKEGHKKGKKWAFKKGD